MSTNEIRQVVTNANKKTQQTEIYVLKDGLYELHDIKKRYTLDNVETLYFMKPNLARKLNMESKLKDFDEKKFSNNLITENRKTDTSAVTLELNWGRSVSKGTLNVFRFTAGDSFLWYRYLHGSYTPKYMRKLLCKKYPAARGMRMYTFDGVNYNPMPANVTFDPTTHARFFFMTPQEAKRLTVIAKANLLREGADRAKEAKAEHKRSLPPKQAAKPTGRNIQIPKLTSDNIQAILDGDIL
ncbi:hypothetical protein GGI07_002842 [Coemansia sp. Benny D115]|nr:hypothetical protein GGI07_002842 [Coemansia sp. Benny D115]